MLTSLSSYAWKHFTLFVWSNIFDFCGAFNMFYINIWKWHVLNGFKISLLLFSMILFFCKPVRALLLLLAALWLSPYNARMRGNSNLSQVSLNVLRLCCSNRPPTRLRSPWIWSDSVSTRGSTSRWGTTGSSAAGCMYATSTERVRDSETAAWSKPPFLKVRGYLFVCRPTISTSTWSWVTWRRRWRRWRSTRRRTRSSTR